MLWINITLTKTKQRKRRLKITFPLGLTSYLKLSFLITLWVLSMHNEVGTYAQMLYMISRNSLICIGMFCERHLLEYSSSKSMKHQTIVVKFHQINNVSITYCWLQFVFLTAATLGKMVKSCIEVSLVISISVS